MGQGVGPPAAAVQGQHELPRQALVQRVPLGACGEFGEQLGVPAEPQPDVGEVEFGRVPLPVPGRAQGVEPGDVQVAEGVAAPQGERLREQRRGAVLAGGGARATRSRKRVHVHGGRIDGEDVGPRAPGDAYVLRRRGQGAAQAGHIAVERGVGALRGPVPPDPVHEPGGRHGGVRVDEQAREHRALADMAQVDRNPVHACLDAAEQNEIHGHPLPPRVDGRWSPQRTGLRIQGSSKVCPTGAHQYSNGRTAGGRRRARRPRRPCRAVPSAMARGG